jgi:hypothetical protein
MGILWAMAPLWASQVHVDSDESVVKGARTVLVAEVMKSKRWRKPCSAGVTTKLRPTELLGGVPEERAELDYVVWWRVSGPGCANKSYYSPPQASNLKKGTVVIVTIGGPRMGDSQVSGSFDLERRPAIEGWLQED